MAQSSRKNGKCISKMNTNDTGSLIYLGVLGAILIFSFFSWKNSFSKFVQFGLIWFIIFLLAILLALIWENHLDKKANGVNLNNGKNELVFTRSIDGHFYINLDINNYQIDFLVDTGASSIILSNNDGKKLGFDTEALSYWKSASTANGEILISPVILDQIKMGPIRFSNVKAFISQKNMKKSLLGMSFINRFKKLEINQSKMTVGI